MSIIVNQTRPFNVYLYTLVPHLSTFPLDLCLLNLQFPVCRFALIFTFSMPVLSLSSTAYHLINAPKQSNSTAVRFLSPNKQSLKGESILVLFC